MYSYATIEGDRIVACWQTEWDSSISHDDDSQRFTILIDDDVYESIKNNLEYFIFEDGKIVEKSTKERSDLQAKRKKWLENNTIRGLQKQIDELRNAKAQ